MSRNGETPDAADYGVQAFVVKELLNEERHNPGSILTLAMLHIADVLVRQYNPIALKECSDALAIIANASSKHGSDKTNNVIAALLAFRDAPDVELPPPIPDDEGIIGEPTIVDNRR